jgi:hypothetical protein
MEAKRSRSLEILLIPIWWLAIAMRDSGDQLQTKKERARNIQETSRGF